MLRKRGGKCNYSRFLIQALDAGNYQFEAPTILFLEMTPFLTLIKQTACWISALAYTWLRQELLRLLEI